MRKKAKVQKINEQQRLNQQAEQLLADAEATKQEGLQPVGDDYPTVMVSINNNLALLKGKSLEEKAELKKNMIPLYEDFLNDYIESGENYPNEVLTRLMIWCLDTCNFESALYLAIYAVHQNQDMPKGFKRDVASFVSELICEWAEKQHADELSASPYFEQVVALIVSGDWDVTHFVILTKIYKLSGMIAQADGEFETAKVFYEMVMEVNPTGHGVKTRHGEVVKILAAQKKAADLELKQQQEKDQQAETENDTETDTETETETETATDEAEE